MNAVLIMALACFLTAVLILVLRPVAMSVGLVDVPDQRKSHQGPIPLVGGIAIFASVLLACAISAFAGSAFQSVSIVAFLSAAGLLVGVGLLDDYVELSPTARFVAEALAVLIMIHGAGVVLADLGRMGFSGQRLELGVAAIPFTIFATIGVINALNMCDGLDGLSGSQTLVSLAGFALAVLLHGGHADMALVLVLAGGVAGFLLFNMRLPGRLRASIFLGDAGSMFLGFALTWLAISLSQGSSPVIKPAAALWFIMVPIMDAVAMMLRRVVRGRSPFAPDREHLHHIFLLAGFSVNQTVAIMALLGVLGVSIGLTGTLLDIPDLYLAGGFLLVGILYFWLIMRTWKKMRFLDRSICRRRHKESDRRCGVDRRQAPAPPPKHGERRSGIERRRAVSRRSEDASMGRREVGGQATMLPQDDSVPESTED